MRISLDTEWKVILGILSEMEGMGHEWSISDKSASYKLRMEKDGKVYSRFEKFKGNSPRVRVITMINAFITMYDRFRDDFNLPTFKFEDRLNVSVT